MYVLKLKGLIHIYIYIQGCVCPPSSSIRRSILKFHNCIYVFFYIFRWLSSGDISHRSSCLCESIYKTFYLFRGVKITLTCSKRYLKWGENCHLMSCLLLQNIISFVNKKSVNVEFRLCNANWLLMGFKSENDSN